MAAPSKPIATKTKAIAMHLQGVSNTEIAKKLDMHPNTVTNILREGNTREISRENAVESAMARAGLTPDSVAKKIAELTIAEEVRLAAFEGKFTDEHKVPDNGVRHRAVELGARILNMLPKEDATATAALFVRMPIQVLADGHSPTCLCAECARAWEEKTRDAITVPSVDL